MKDFDVRYRDNMVFGFRMVSDTTFEIIADRFECMRRNTYMLAISRVEMT